MQPTLDEIQAALNKAVLMILNVSHVVKRWGQSSHKDLTTRPKHVTLQGNDDCFLVYISLLFYRNVLIFQLEARPHQLIFFRITDPQMLFMGTFFVIPQIQSTFFQLFHAALTVCLISIFYIRYSPPLSLGILSCCSPFSTLPLILSLVCRSTYSARSNLHFIHCVLGLY